MDGRKRAWWKYVAEVVVAAIADSAAMAFIYALAYCLRTDFTEPVCGWRRVAFSAVVVVAIQLAALAIAGVYRKNWSRFSLADGVRMVLALFATCVVFVILRGGLPAISGARPPYSVSVINFALVSAALVAVRVLYRGFAEAWRARGTVLGRECVLETDPRAIEMLHGKCVMVTGAGGSIGGELSRQIYLAGPRKLILLERSENALYEINRRLRGLGGETELVPQMTDVCNLERMEAIFSEHRPDIVIHAAAYKHVPMVEENPKEGLRNNFLASIDLGRMAKAHGARKFVFISTDKAVRPKSVMGITKRLSELGLLRLNGGPTVFCAVRFGNVLGSSGSAIPLFEEQVREGRPVTVTHSDMRRYFMTVGEAVSLVLKAAAIAKSGEVFVLDMGEPYRIVDIAEAVIRKAGYRPYVDIPIIFTGIRPGEKLFEELDVSERSAIRTSLNKIYICRENDVPANDMDKAEETARRLAEGAESDDSVRARLAAIAKSLGFDIISDQK